MLCFTFSPFHIRIAPTMTDSIDTTQPTIIPPKKNVRKSKFLKWAGILLAFFAIISIGAILGYQQGITMRTHAEANQVVQVVEEQYGLALVDIEDGRYEIALQRLEYVAELYPSYPGLTDQLANVLIILNATATPTIAPSPTIEPTALPTNVSTHLVLFSQAEEHLADEAWDLAISTLELLRKENPDHRSVDVDGMIYISLRQRGIQKISVGNLEGGIYDLTLAEGFGILDTEAKGWRNWASYYITGASFWQVDWEQAIYYFAQVAPITPNLHDGSGWTASQRYLEALLSYAELLEDQKEWCQAEIHYKLAHDYTDDPKYLELIEITSDKCR